jgi:hypothetical protein
VRTNTEQHEKPAHEREASGFSSAGEAGGSEVMEPFVTFL